MDFYEILDYCAFDVDEAKKVIEEVLTEVGLEKLESESDSKDGWRLCCACCCPCPWR